MPFKHIPNCAGFQWINNQKIIELLVNALPYAGTGRRGYGKELLLRWLIYKQRSGCTYRDLESTSGIDYSTFIKFRQQLQTNRWLEYYFQAVAHTFASDRKLTLVIDSSFVEQYARNKESGAEYSGYKRKTGFKTHQIIDFKTRLPLATITTGGARADIMLAKQIVKSLPKGWRVKAFLGDKGYDGLELVQQIRHKWPGVKVSIPVRRTNQAAWRCPRQETVKNRQAKLASRCLTRTLYNQRTKIERYFSRKKGVFHLGQERTRGIHNFTTNVLLTDIMAQLEYLAKPEGRCFSPSSHYILTRLHF